ncbi:MAG: flagellar biosynthetic protein FliO [Pseudomonadota bacterium]
MPWQSNCARWPVRGTCAAGLWFLATVPAVAQTLGQGDGGPDISIWRVIGALLFCLLLAAGAAFALRHRMRGGGQLLPLGERRLRLIETLRLSQQTDLCLVDCDGEILLLGISAAGVVRLERQADAKLSTPRGDEASLCADI